MKLKLLALSCAVATATFFAPQALADTSYTQPSPAALAYAKPVLSKLSGDVTIGYGQGDLVATNTYGETGKISTKGVFLGASLGAPVYKSVLGQLSLGGELGYMFPSKGNIEVNGNSYGFYKLGFTNLGVYFGTEYKFTNTFSLLAKVSLGYQNTSLNINDLITLSSGGVYTSVSLGGLSYDHFTYGVKVSFGSVDFSNFGHYQSVGSIGAYVGYKF